MKQVIFALMLGTAIFAEAQTQINGIIAENDSTFTIELGDMVVTANRKGLSVPRSAAY